MVDFAFVILLTQVSLLGDECFAVRQAAQAQIEATMPYGLGYLKAVIKDDEELEIRRRCQTIVDRYCHCLPTHYPVSPWLDMLPKDYPDRGLIIDKYLRLFFYEGWNRDSHDWPEYRAATDSFVRDLLWRGYPKPKVQRILDQMATEEKKYRLEHGWKNLEEPK